MMAAVVTGEIDGYFPARRLWKLSEIPRYLITPQCSESKSTPAKPVQDPALLDFCPHLPVKLE